MAKPIITCVFCGSRKPSSNEHVVQNALGGVDGLKEVCGDCNQELAAIDRVLCVESPLSIFVRRELGGVGPNSWDIDDAQNGLLLEARTTPGTDSMTLVPQVVFDGDERLIYCDGDDIITLGKDEAQDRFYTRLRRAYEHFQCYGPLARKRDHRKGQDMLKFSPVARIREGFRLPPRICCNQRLVDFTPKKGVMFDLRYLTEEDRDRVLDKLSTFDWAARAKESKLQLGAELPELHISFCVTHAVRALAKVGFNLLAFYCASTPVDREHFQQTVEWILEGKHMPVFGDERKFGFVAPADVAELACPARSHKFRLTHDLSTNTWKLYAAFFEGKAAAYTEFHGPNMETWATMDVVVPYDLPMPAPTFDEWYRPLDTNPVIDARKILPTVPWQTGETRVRREPVVQE